MLSMRSCTVEWLHPKYDGMLEQQLMLKLGSQEAQGQRIDAHAQRTTELAQHLGALTEAVGQLKQEQAVIAQDVSETVNMLAAMLEAATAGRQTAADEQ